MKIVNLIKSEFVKNYSIKKLIIINLVMLIVAIGFVEIYGMFYQKGFSVYYTHDSIADELEKKEELSLEEDYYLKLLEVKKPILAYLNSLKLNGFDYRERIADELSYAYSNRFGIEVIKNHYDDPIIQKLCTTDQYQFNTIFEGDIHHLCISYSEEELNSFYLENEQKIMEYSRLLKEPYYKYVEYRLEKGLIPDNLIEMANFVILNKVDTNSNYLAYNDQQYGQLEINVNRKLLEENKFKGYDENGNKFASYNDYVRYYGYLKEVAIKDQKIIYYSSLNRIAHDLELRDSDHVYEEFRYITTKSNVNLIFHFSIVVMILVSITAGGIVSSEHNKGTIKNIITAPVRRWKILLSKFIYLILHAYIIWLIGLLFLSIYSGIKYGFSDLFTPKLLYTGNKVIEVNYYFNLLKDLFIASIPVICFLSILFCLSTITLNTSLTVGITTILSVVSPILWFICDILKCKLLVYTPFLFFDTGFIHGRLQPYISSMRWIDVSYNRGIIISIIVTLVLYIITNIIYSKRDIKN